MPRNPEKKRVEAALDEATLKIYSEEAQKRDWSNKKLNEKIIRWWLGEIGKLPRVDRP